MVAGFLGTILFKLVVPPVLTGIGWERGAAYLNALDVLLPSFVLSGLVAVTISRFSSD